MSYQMLEDIDEKSTIFPLRIAFSFLSSAAAFSFMAVLMYIKAGLHQQTYISTLSTIINLVAAYHYYEMLKVRVKDKISPSVEWNMGALRHSDWAVTMPLLVLKLYALINNADHDLLLNSVDLSAFLAAIMILLGAYCRLDLDELVGWDTMTTLYKITGLGCYIGSWTILVLLLIDLTQSYSEVDNNVIVYSFFLVWPCYGVVACVAVWQRQGSTGYPKNVALMKDVVYSGLDIFSKGVFAYYTSSMAFGISVLGS